ncbi:UDP-N-acetylglucosamine 4,6-dehydratase (inverting) [bacterium (Candidatus Gribaldobacteria) CG23_combo_of_CG06-09_8_20_14_all_37_87_8]|uniref:UDP-N-acetylglucosamine 4,6-dehydratase (Inverting) n=2 Tax=Candidatus Gribaldobacteria TaxID=2798536 RepID=A0A2G9ZDV6_9BACT|nr:MAG: UDP-N-acetylglucosamine 4,6-dehydratase (inverting) [Parcubacteria group bacterium CG1_02_37_13]PIP31346.1 MAG: UDP-N-acetylglucosamine 4,6-dehydratase (inverting) [bacterium (Candidatus Gribaldobacteria) CG23_combo_of_CG06-09_8_20_14_all_37_87_8]PIR90552.1 MAG: UDP-N-acetylglucosamine 4,6-dehydratase (inverting) [bacterium (Candidatus Gribaldobacteria) CG10_big_fil_rev_8_21_14_0_10_37_21]
MLNNKTILLTGAAGSFGTKFIEVALRDYNVKSLRAFDISEIGLVNLRRKFQNNPKLRYFIGDVRDHRRLMRATADVDIVIHAAALKHVGICEYNPIEAVKTNVEGAIDVVDATISNGVEKVINISTDKAAYPVNLYGAVKMVAEKIFIQGNAYTPEQGHQGRTILSCTRYGNVVGSSGSVVPLFKEQAKQGKITITHKDMTRFWIELEEGVKFVIECLKEMKGGEIFVPKIPSMKIMDLAQVICPDVEKEITGIRPGEKINETLITKEEARHTKDMGKYFVIEPEFPFWIEDKVNQGKALPDDFTYSSDNNPNWLSPDQLKEIIDRC